MGLFDNKKTIESTINEIKSTFHYDFITELVNYDLTEFKNLISDDELVCELLIQMARKNININEFVNDVTNIYELVCINKDKDFEKDLFEKLAKLYIKSPFTFTCNKKDVFSKVYSAFDDKQIVYEYYKYIVEKIGSTLVINSNKNIYNIMTYVSKAREYYVDDRALLSSALNFFEESDVLSYWGSNADVSDLINEKLKEDKKACGIYDVDKGQLAEIDKKLDSVINGSRRLDDLIKEGNTVIENIELSVKDAKDEISKLKLRELEELQAKANNILSSFKIEYKKLLSEEKNDLSSEKDKIVGEIKLDISKKLQELNDVLREIDIKINKNSLDIDTASKTALSDIENYIQNSEQLKKVIKESQEDKDFIEKINGLTDEILKQNSKKTTVAQSQSEDNKSVIVGVPSKIVTPEVIIKEKEERKINPNVNFFFDESIPFKKRFDEFLKRKEKLQKTNGEIYHDQFDNIAKIIMEGRTPYMYGPSGCGKTYMIEKQLSEIFGIDVVTNGYILYEQDIIGYTSAGNGSYVPGNFYRCFKYGDIIFLDELDNGIANATVVLNRFLGSNNDKYTFPDGITLNRHPNFRIVTAGNTSGNGRTSEYNTRQKLDESVLQRLTPIKVNYDNRIEAKILKDYPGWYNFAVNFRKAISELPSQSGDEENTAGTFTTRDAASIKKYLDDKAFNDEQLLLYEIIETKDIDTLTRVGDAMNRYKDKGEFNTKEGVKLLTLYNNLVDMRR
ncbi:MAG: AAA family ATPase [Bacilli bacterium]|nr:AAA family ATPase [Bacilli bacterium]